jgi:hypothetical protein
MELHWHLSAAANCCLNQHARGLSHALRQANRLHTEIETATTIEKIMEPN